MQMEVTIDKKGNGSVLVMNIQFFRNEM